ncbi:MULTISPECIES: FadR/GntR family transcriptional regulator [unclassified Streptomyces]|uniref:FadR/GntR family transcriptional regulator n=1 Tax=unclassified Streptomyces TaxID=2593676 RepID=UPI0022564208|nr:MULTISPECIES: FCD domain-containing protein [unclassified Streptomyces]MCX4649407.1 FCD domain-containing protein [Streptomyces sp. NBC_01446]MCX5321394.1 FCD domain-containing protein [Streptomyces sp. NBC_00120]
MVVRRGTLADQVSQEITALIENAGLQPGDEIPPEGELATRFGVNRLAVREAIRTLAAREMVLSSQGKPTRVHVPTAQVFGQVLRFRLRQDSLRFADVLDARRAIEGALVRRAAERVRAGGASLDQAEELLDRMRETTGSRERFVDLDIAFHTELAALAGNGMLTLALDAMTGILREHRLASYAGHATRGDSHDSTIAAHHGILKAVRSGDPVAAAEAMESHLSETEKDINAGN